MSLRVLVVNKEKSTADIRHALHGENIIPSCINPVLPQREHILFALNTETHGVFGRYDLVVIDIADSDLANRLACAIRIAHPKQEVISIIRDLPILHACCAVLVPDMSGAIAAIKRMRV